jgi:hypothetical protein
MPQSRSAVSTKGTSARRAAEYREALLNAIRPDDVRAIVAAVVKRAKNGDLSAAKLILDRVCGSEALPDWPSESAIRQGEWLESLAPASWSQSSAPWPESPAS